MGKGWQREKPQAASFLFRNLLKTTSEWLQNSPVLPLSSIMKWFRRIAGAIRVEPRESSSLTVICCKGVFILGILAKVRHMKQEGG